MNADIGYVAAGAFCLMLAEPVVAPVVIEKSSAVCIDMDAIIVGPDGAGDNIIIDFVLSLVA